MKKNTLTLIIRIFLIAILGVAIIVFLLSGSIEKGLAQSYGKYRIEDGHFVFKNEPSEFLLEETGKEGISLYEQYYKTVDTDKLNSLSIYTMHEDINCTEMKNGRWPSADNEIVIDKSSAKKEKLKTGDELSINGKTFTICGIAFFTDGVDRAAAIVTEEGYDSIEANETYCCSWIYAAKPSDEEKEKQRAAEFEKKIRLLVSTGGMADNEETAAEIRNTRAEWSTAITEVKAAAGDIEKEKAQLQAAYEELAQKSEPYRKENDELGKEAASVQSTREYLMREIFAYLISTGAIRDYTEIENNENELSPEIMALLPADLKSRAAALQQRSDALQEKYEELDERYSYIADETEALQEKADAISEEEAKLKEQEEGMQEIMDSLSALEIHDDDINEITSFVPAYDNKDLLSASMIAGRVRIISIVLIIISLAGLWSAMRRKKSSFGRHKLRKQRICLLK